MGREIKRVTKDFAHPIGETWSGYINPYYDDKFECPKCDGTSYTFAHRRLEDLVRLIMLSGSDAAKPDKSAHPYFRQDSLHNSYGIVADPDMVELTAGLAGRQPDSIWGHDSSDSWKAVKAVIAAAGLDADVWGLCDYDDGLTNEDASARANWTPADPPVGECYQVWETVSEGSPISPVFTNAEECAEWVSENESCDLAAARRFVDLGYAPSFSFMTSGLITTGIQAMSLLADQEDE
jgi:hypothetical protein